jgi:TRAP-type C4-dicarboxylate transport system permease small subunit
MTPRESMNEIAQGMSSARLGSVANAAMVNRTHRVVRERARQMADERTRRRSLWIPITICSAFVLVLCSALWRLFDAYDSTIETQYTGIPDASHQIFLLLMWFLPLTGALLAVVVFRRNALGRDDRRDA